MTHAQESSSVRDLDAALVSLNTPPMTAYALAHFREVACRKIRKDGTIDPQIARRLLKEAPSGTVPAKVMEAMRLTLHRAGIRATRVSSDDDDRP